MDGASLLITPLRHTGKRTSARLLCTYVFSHGNLNRRQLCLRVWHVHGKTKPVHASLVCALRSGPAAHVRGDSRPACPRQLPGRPRLWRLRGELASLALCWPCSPAVAVASVWLVHSLRSFQCANPRACCRPAHLLACLQAIAAVLSDGSLALLPSVEEDLWEETLDEQLDAQPWYR